MKNNFIKHAFLFFLLVFVQVALFKNVRLFRHAQPMLYILFIFLYPITSRRGVFIIIAFLLGLSIDFFSNSGGINAAATLLIAFIRLPILRIATNKSDFDPILFRFNNLPLNQQINYLFSLSFIHHFTVFSLSYFKINAFKFVMIDAFASSIFTLFLILLYSQLFLKKVR